MAPAHPHLPKAPTGIPGLDEITNGGLPAGRPTLVCGAAGCGKTLLAMEFLIHGATQFDEPGVFMAFEETVEELTENVASLGFDLTDLIARQRLVVDFVAVERSEIEEAGEYNLEGLFIRLGLAIDSINARRVVLDTIETLFAGLPNPLILRAELRRLFRWLKARGVTAIITGERGDHLLTRHGLEEYVSDCVIVLDHRVTELTSTRRLRIAKYRGTTHGTSEYPFLIDEQGISIVPVTSLGLEHSASSARISSGIPRLDTMLGGQGYYQGSSVLISGSAGTGKSSIAAHFADAACRRGERVLYFAFEESPSQIMRNMRSIGLELEPWVRQQLLQFQAIRPTTFGLELHLTTMHKAINRFKPAIVIVDPLNSFTDGSNTSEVKAMLVRLIDFLKLQQITSLFTSLTMGGSTLEQTDVEVSSLIDTWLLVRDMELGGERNRGLYILKSRGMAHSNQIREFLLTARGVELCDVYVGPGGVLTGSARLAQEASERAALLLHEQQIEHHRVDLERKRQLLEAQITVMRSEFEQQVTETRKIIEQAQLREVTLLQDREAMAEQRRRDATPNKRGEHNNGV